jgi:hypothetical protein
MRAFIPRAEAVARCPVLHRETPAGSRKLRPSLTARELGSERGAPGIGGVDILANNAGAYKLVPFANCWKGVSRAIESMGLI